MFSRKSSLVAAAALAVVLGGCSGAEEDGHGALNVSVSAMGGAAAKVYIQVTNGTDTWTVQAGDPTPTSDEWLASIAALQPGSYTVRAWGYSPEQVAANPAIQPPASARYETRGTPPTFTVVAGTEAFVRLVLTELVPDVTRHAPYSDFISVSAATVFFGGSVVITANGFDPDGDLRTWSFSDDGSGAFTPAASGTFGATGSSYTATWTPGPTAQGDVQILLTVVDAQGNSSAVAVTVTVGTTTAAFTAEIDAAPLVVTGLGTTDGQLAVNERTTLSSAFYDLAAEPLAVSWSDDCGGVFENRTFGLADPVELEGPTNPYVATAQFRTAVVPDFNACYVTLTITDLSGSMVVQNLGITVGNPSVVYGS